jgi:hypothetical protein
MMARGLGRSVVLYMLACVVVMGLAGAGLVWVFGAAAERRAVLVSAGVALAVQAVAFVVARMLARGGNGIAGWTLGAVICLVTLVVYGFICRAVGLPANAALLSLATFFFLTELIEPPLLNV